MEDLNAQLTVLLGGNALFGDASPLASSLDIDALTFLNAETPTDAVFSSPSFSAQTSPFLGGSMTIPTADEQSLEALFTPALSSNADELSLEALLTPGLSSSSLTPSLDPFSPATGMLDLFPAPSSNGSPTLQLAQSLLGGNMDVSGIVQGMVAQAEAAARAQTLAAAVTAQMLANATPTLPPPPPAQGGDLQLAAMLLNIVREKKSAPTPSAPVVAVPKTEEIPSDMVIDPVTGKLRKKVGRKKKPRPTDPEVIAAELARKRSKNTEAARRSRLKRMQKVDTLEDRLKMLEEERDAFEKRVAELEAIKAVLEARVEELEAGEMSE